MPKLPRPSLEKILKDYDRHQLANALDGLVTNIGFQALQAYIEQERDYCTTIAIQQSQLDGHTVNAAAFAGQAAAFNEVLTRLIPKYVAELRGEGGAAQSERPEE
jgi:hypothetical protein